MPIAREYRYKRGAMLSALRRKHVIGNSACFRRTESMAPGFAFVGRWLLCCVLLAACGCGDSAQERAERTIAKLVKDHNARMVVDENLPNHPIIKLDFSDTKTFDSELVPLADLADLKELILTGTKISDAAVDSFADLPQLQVLTLSDDQIT